jgi:hypothetical protein
MQITQSRRRLVWFPVHTHALYNRLHFLSNMQHSRLHHHLCCVLHSHLNPMAHLSCHELNCAVRDARHHRPHHRVMRKDSIIRLGDDLKLHPWHLAERPAELGALGMAQLKPAVEDIEHLAEVKARVVIFLAILMLAMSHKVARVVLDDDLHILAGLVVTPTLPDEMAIFVTEVLGQVKANIRLLAMHESAHRDELAGFDVDYELFSHLVECCLNMDSVLSLVSNLY